MSDLSLAPSRTAANTISLEQCLREHSKLEVLENGNEWYCGNCKTHQKATKQVTFWRGKLPEVLILSLKRFEFRGSSSPPSSPMAGRYSAMFGNSSGGHREKIEDFVDFPLEGLDLTPFCHQSSWSSVSYDNLSEISSGSNGSNSTKKPSALYDLFAICNHYGRMGFGHYTAFARDYVDDQLSPQWYSFDDDLVRACASPEEVKTRAAYMLFYRRRPV
jgi:ubiquitin carboxyl-terminal hydrolase 4/11